MSKAAPRQILGSHYSFVPQQLFQTLTSEYDPAHHVEWMLVTAVWYGKKTKSVQHEFILIMVEDSKVQLQNFLVLDRNVGERASVSATKNPFRVWRRAAISSQGSRGPAMDAFKISYNGIERQLLQECQLLPREYLEKIEFSHTNPLFLYQLVTLVNIISEKGPEYSLNSRNCYWFAGTIWECLRLLRPDAQYNAPLACKRGTLGIIRYNLEEKDNRDICAEFKTAMLEVDTNLSAGRKMWRKMRASATNPQPGPSECLSNPERTNSNGSSSDIVEGNTSSIDTSTPHTTPPPDTVLSSAVSHGRSKKEELDS